MTLCTQFLGTDADSARVSQLHGAYCCVRHTVPQPSPTHHVPFPTPAVCPPRPVSSPAFCVLQTKPSTPNHSVLRPASFCRAGPPQLNRCSSSAAGRRGKCKPAGWGVRMVSYTLWQQQVYLQHHACSSVGDATHTLGQQINGTHAAMLQLCWVLCGVTPHASAVCHRIRGSSSSRSSSQAAAAVQ